MRRSIPMKLALAQINTTVGDFDGNLARIVGRAQEAAAAGVDLVLYPELCISGYMPRDLLREPDFVDAAKDALDRLVATPGLPPLLVGCPLRADVPPMLHNAAVLIRNGEATVVHKTLLPSYDVFDELRYFLPAEGPRLVELGGVRVGITICEDAWGGPTTRYVRDPVTELAAAGADLVVNMSASPYEGGKPAYRRELFGGHAATHGIPVAYCNLVGGNDQLLFDGNSFLYDGDGSLSGHAAAFREDLLVVEASSQAEAPGDSDDKAEALRMGIRDYFRKTGFSDALVGLSGGIDSALTACLAVDALGPDHVTGIALPGPYSSDHSREDAAALAMALGIRFQQIGIDSAYGDLLGTLQEAWGDRPFDHAEENLQARLRGTVLMALSNKTGALVLVTSNKSELAMGYCTLYGDMVGALAPLSDLYKGEVYNLAREYADRIPERTFQKPPSAELRPNQTDQDSLPPYDVLDGILWLHLEERKPAADIVAAGYDSEVVDSVVRAVARSEYKRQQGAPVLKVSRKAFDLGRRYPIVQRFERT